MEMHHCPNCGAPLPMGELARLSGVTFAEPSFATRPSPPAPPPSPPTFTPNQSVELVTDSIVGHYGVT